MAARRWFCALAIPMLAGLALAGCGGGASSSSSSAARRAPSHPRPGAGHARLGSGHAGPSAGPPASAAAIRVIIGWSDALRRGDVQAAARYFRLPSVFADGSDPPVAIHNLAQAQAVNRSLPCGAKLLSAHRMAGDVNALFKLTSRTGPGGGSCGSGTGRTARTDFDIRRGRIVAWVRAPDQPGDNPGPPQTSTSSAGGPQV